MNSEYQYERLFRALGDGHRLTILKQLAQREMNAGEILETVDVVQSTLSHHMKTLCESGLVIPRKNGKWTCYTLDRHMLKTACAYLQTLEAEAKQVQQTPLSGDQNAEETLQPEKKKTEELQQPEEKKEEKLQQPEEKKEEKLQQPESKKAEELQRPEKKKPEQSELIDERPAAKGVQHRDEAVPVMQEEYSGAVESFDIDYSVPEKKRSVKEKNKDKQDKGKGKSKDKAKVKGKEKSREKVKDKNRTKNRDKDKAREGKGKQAH